MKKTKTVNVWCCECDCAIEVEEVQQVGNFITCQECGNVHEVDSDYNEVGDPFWYLVSV